MEKSSPSAADRRVIIGKVGVPHGVKGEMKIIPMTDFPDRFRNMEHCFFGERRLSITGVRYQRDRVLMTVEGITTREGAAAMTGLFLSVNRSEAVPLNKGEYYMADIMGLSVEETDGNVLGTVTDIIRTGSNDVYVVSLPGRREDVLVPALKSVVREISVEEGRMVVAMPEVME